MNVSEHFDDSLWPLVIKPAIENANKKIDPSFAEYVGSNCLFFNDKSEGEYKSQLSSLYERKREWLKKIYFGFAKPDDKKLLDMHKIAAIICRCIIGCKPFSFDVSKANEYKEANGKNEQLDWIIDNYFVNYKVAVNCAFAITMYDLIDKLGKEEKNDPIIDVPDIVQKLSKEGFDLYQAEPFLLKSDHETYYKSMILDTAINDINKRDFDYLGFAASCFQLQQYEILRCEYLRSKK